MHFSEDISGKIFHFQPYRTINNQKPHGNLSLSIWFLMNNFI
jgi:hypothetical protein